MGIPTDTLILSSNWSNMIGWIRQYKWAYALYNYFQQQRLGHLKRLYPKYGLDKRYYEPVSSADFDHLPGAGEESIVPDITGLQADALFPTLNPATQQSLLAYPEDGYAVLKGWLSPDEVDKANAEVQRLLDDQAVRFRYSNKKLMFAIHHSDYLRRIGEHPHLQAILNYLLNGEARLFQSINFVHEGSEQKTHSDSVHMTTYPLGGLLGVWIALEDMTPENGPLHYYPGSHKLPYLLNEAYGNKGTRWKIGNQPYTAYEAMMEKKIREWGLEKQIFEAKAGDVLIWHANLLHGGEPHRDKSLPRKSMVLHYFREGYICYHEVTQRPALLS